MEKSNNPWRGLRSYADPDKSKSTYQFCGRDSAVGSIFAMIDNNLLVTMYGKTGIGKTSVLNAGVFPLLRSRRYVPVSIRLGKYVSDRDVSFAECIVNELTEELQSYECEIVTSFPEYSKNNSLSIEFLWRYFLTHSFFNKSGEEVYPVLTLDQFEEVFIGNTNNAVLLLKQVYALIDDNREVPDIDGYSDNTNFRVVFSIREDDLFYLEDAIDMNHLVEMKQNRYRLCPLTEQEARDVVLIGKNYMESGSEDEIAVRIMNLSRDEYSHISTNILSLVCSQLFIQSNGEMSLRTLDSFSKNPLESFYLDCMSHVEDVTEKYIENNLVDQDRRRFVSKTEFDNTIPEKDYQTLVNGEYRILQKVTAGNTECIELIHDSIAKTIYNLKNKNEEQLKYNKLIRRNKRIKRWIVVLFIVVIAAIGLIGWQYSNYQSLREVDRNDSFVINVVEDSMVVADNDFWQGRLLVYGLSHNKKDTILVDINLDKSLRNKPIDVHPERVSAVHVVMQFKDSQYAMVDTVYKMCDLKACPSINLPIRRILPQMYEYSSRIVVDVCGEEVCLQDAIVILHDKIQRTDYNGNFTFCLEDTIQPSDVLYIVRKNFKSVEEANLIENGVFRQKFFVVPIDSMSQFEFVCESLDSIKYEDWIYRTAKKTNPRGTLLECQDGQEERLLLYAKPEAVTSDGKYAVKGFYYYLSEYNRMKEIGHPHYAYRILEGWIERRMTNNLQTYVFNSYDAFGNRQQIKGNLLRSSKMQGIIYYNGLPIASFGGAKIDER